MLLLQMPTPLQIEIMFKRRDDFYTFKSRPVAIFVSFRILNWLGINCIALTYLKVVLLQYCTFMSFELVGG